MTSIEDVIQYRSLKAVQEIFEGEPDLLNKQSDIGFTPLHLSIHSNKIKVAEYLIGLGAEVNTCCIGGDTPLITAVSMGKPIKLAKLLIEAGADVKATRDQLPVLWWAALSGNQKAVDLLLKSGAELDLNSAVFLKPVEYFQKELEKNPNALLEAPCPAALLSDAISLFYYPDGPEKVFALVELFLKHKVDPNAKAPNKIYPLVEAVIQGVRGMEIAKLLLERGADPNVLDWRGWPLDKTIDESITIKPPEKEQFKSLLREHGANF